MFSLRAFFNKKSNPDWMRIPAGLRDIAQKGEYLRTLPYPVNKIIQDLKAEPFVTKNTKIITMGSCFAQELQIWLRKNGYNCLPHEWGVIYTPLSISQIIQYSFEINSWNPEEPFWIRKDKYYFPYLKADNHSGPKYLGDDELSAQDVLCEHYRKSAELLKEADLIVWTLGLTELWRNKKDHKAYYAIPYPDIYNPDQHEFYNLSYDDVNISLEYAYLTVKKFNPKVKILFSVSPVPLSISFRLHLGPYIATQYSKSILHAAALALIEKYEDILYMPSYEITRNNPRVSYRPDGRHVNKRCINTIMDAFKRLYVVD